MTKSCTTLDLEEIRKAAEAGSPMVDNTANPTPLSGAVTRVG